MSTIFGNINRILQNIKKGFIFEALFCSLILTEGLSKQIAPLRNEISTLSEQSPTHLIGQLQ